MKCENCERYHAAYILEGQYICGICLKKHGSKTRCDKCNALFEKNTIYLDTASVLCAECYCVNFRNPEVAVCDYGV